MPGFPEGKPGIFSCSQAGFRVRSRAPFPRGRCACTGAAGPCRGRLCSFPHSGSMAVRHRAEAPFPPVLRPRRQIRMAGRGGEGSTLASACNVECGGLGMTGAESGGRIRREAGMSCSPGGSVDGPGGAEVLMRSHAAAGSSMPPVHIGSGRVIGCEEVLCCGGSGAGAAAAA